VTEAATALAPGATVEVATWRPLEVAEVGGWRVGFSGGFTRRANSVLPLAAPPDVDGALDQVEAWYAARGVPARFRVGSEARPTDLDRRLERRGYRVAATTQVLTRPVDGRVLDDLRNHRPHDDGHGAFTVGDVPDDDWLAGWLDVKATGPVDRDAARAVVAGSPASYLTARDDAGVTGVIRVAYAGPWAGLSCLMVAWRARRRGLARALTIEGLRVAVDRGADRAFLQVEAANRPAIVLYERLGFALADTYHYREL
jgi:ribosomal protein S18 acetylase RimI-like enzyme